MNEYFSSSRTWADWAEEDMADESCTDDDESGGRVRQPIPPLGVLQDVALPLVPLLLLLLDVVKVRMAFIHFVFIPPPLVPALIPPVLAAPPLLIKLIRLPFCCCWDDPAVSAINISAFDPYRSLCKIVYI